jgi:prokaryotic ubiquitin-like protein Pup
MQEQKQRPAKTEPEELVEQEIPEPKEFDLEALLDEIDGVLEENAKDFVDAYIQKGGQ